MQHPANLGERAPIGKLDAIRKRVELARMLMRYGRTLARVRLRRAISGPKRQGWTAQFEALVEVLRRDADSLREATFPAIRAHMDGRPLGSRVLSRVAREKVQVGGLRAEWFCPRDARRGDDTRGTILYLHGGGYCVGSIRTHRDLLARLCLAAHAEVLALEYRLAPEHPYPAAVDDAVSAYRWLRAKEGGAREARKIVIGGDSAGGGLTMATLLALRDAGDELPRAGILLSPWVDLRGREPSIRENADYDWIDEVFLHRCAQDYRGTLAIEDPRLAPLQADLKGLPPLLFQLGGAEILLDEGRRLAERAEAAGVEVTLDVTPDMIHVFQLFAEVVPQGAAAIARIGRYVTTRT
ncbi:MAG: alpha/beta hydrolase [Polyangiales bacterium]